MISYYFMQKVIVIGASTGGPPALEQLLCELPRRIGVPVIVIQHMPGTFTPQFARGLHTRCALPVFEAEEGEIIKPDFVYVIPGNHHFFFESPGPRVRLIPEERGLSPSVDMGMISAVDHYGPGVIGVILSGMGKDGLTGAKAIKQLGGYVIAESEESAAIYGMPREAVEAGLADEIIPLPKIAARLVELASGN